MRPKEVGHGHVTYNYAETVYFYTVSIWWFLCSQFSTI